MPALKKVVAVENGFVRLSILITFMAEFIRPLSGTVAYPDHEGEQCNGKIYDWNGLDDGRHNDYTRVINFVYTGAHGF